jgi:hypothetical protein
MSRLHPLSAALGAMVEMLDRELDRADKAADLARLRTYTRRRSGEDDPREESDEDDSDIAS